MKSSEFFVKALNGELKANDFDCGSKKSDVTEERELYNRVRQKMKHIRDLPSLLDEPDRLPLQENFKKGSIPCCLGTTNCDFSVGFIGKSLQPLTLLNGNELDTNKAIGNLKITKIRISNKSK